MSSETQNFLRSPAVFRWRPAAWLGVTGNDSFEFLQGQFSNDLRPLATSGSVYGLWLDRKGKVLADSFVCRAEEAQFWLGSYTSNPNTIRERLEAFIIADDVTVIDVTETRRGITIFGDGMALEGFFRELGAIELHARRGASAREWVWLDSVENRVRVDEALAHVNATEVTAAEAERMRIDAGIPSVPTDIGPGELPQEGGLDTSAVSFSKGCYLGQEVMARLKTMGAIRRRLSRVQGAGAPPSGPAPLFQDGKKIGELRSTISYGNEFRGLALVTLLNVRSDAPVVAGEGVHAVNIRFLDSP